MLLAIVEPNANLVKLLLPKSDDYFEQFSNLLILLRL